MNAQDLKNSILQLAIQGKLVEQRKEEGTAKELIKQIEAEKKHLIKEGKIKKQKELPEIKEDEIPFDIPESWEWVRLGDLCNYGKCNSTPSKNIPKDAWLLDLEDIEKDSGRVLNKKRMKDIKSTSSKHIFRIGDVLYSKLRPYLNKVVIADEDGYSTSEILPLDFGTYVYNRYAKTVLMSPYFINYTVKCSYGVKMPRLGTTDGQLAVFPVPPLEEQKRIVAKIEELMPYVDKYDVAYSEVEKLNKKFPEDMQKSILQYAIQGKLAEQREEDGTAEDLYKQIQEEKKKLIREGKIKKSNPLPEITEDETPFDIPENWKWVRLEQVCEYIQRGKSPKYSDVKKYPVVAQKCNQWSGFSLEKAKFIDPKTLGSYTEDRILKDGDLMWNSTGLGTLGRVAIYEVDKNPYELAVADSHVTVIRPLKQYVNFKYLYYYIANPSVQSIIEKQSYGSTKQIELATDTVKNYIFPLPPAKEQKRIVDKIEELLPYTKKLVKKHD